MEDILFLDTNIVLDLVARREPFFEGAEQIFNLAERGEVILLISSLSFINIHYILRKQLSEEETRNILRGLRSLCKVSEIGEREIDLGLVSGNKDFEDSAQYFSALASRSDVIITRDSTGFKDSEIPVMPPIEYINSRE